MKIKKIMKIIDQNKAILLFFSLIFSLLIIIGSTYSWITYSDEKINVSKPNKNKLSATIDEQYTPNLKWSPNEKTEKILTIRNDGKTPAIVRVSLYEFFLQFEIDISEESGNGGFKYVNQASATTIDRKDVTTWGTGNTYKVENNKYLVAKEVFKADTTDSTTAYQYNQAHSFSALDYVTIQFNQDKLFDDSNQPPEGTESYWYYSKGFFYYSEVLQPGEKTVPLIQSATLDAKLPNAYKGSFYQLVPVMEAHDNTSAIVNDWNLDTGSFEEEMYRQKTY